jgi:hypothetical protein
MLAKNSISSFRLFSTNMSKFKHKISDNYLNNLNQNHYQTLMERQSVEDAVKYLQRSKEPLGHCLAYVNAVNEAREILNLSHHHDHSHTYYCNNTHPEFKRFVKELNVDAIDSRKLTLRDFATKLGRTEFVEMLDEHKALCKQLEALAKAPQTNILKNPQVTLNELIKRG